MFWYAIYAYVVCNHITAITLNAEFIGDIAYNMPWYQLPRSEQMIIEMIIRRSQQPCEIKGLGLFVCSLETFLGVREVSLLFRELLLLTVRSYTLLLNLL